MTPITKRKKERHMAAKFEIKAAKNGIASIGRSAPEAPVVIAE